jgi:hypothetical protein
MDSSTRKQTRCVCTFLLLALLSPMTLVGCSAGSGSGGGNAQVNNNENPTPSGNNPPVADPGEGQVVTAGADVTLDGSQSSDPDGDTITFSWEQTLGTPVSLDDASQPLVTFTAPATGTTLRFDLTVSDGQSQSTGAVSVTVEPVESSAQVEESRQSSITDDPAVTGDFPDTWLVPLMDVAPPPSDESELEEFDEQLAQTQFAPVVEEDLSPGQTTMAELDVPDNAELVGSARWIGTTDPLDVTIAVNGSTLATGTPYHYGQDRGGALLSATATTGGRATMSVNNTSAVTVKVKIVFAGSRQ